GMGGPPPRLEKHVYNFAPGSLSFREPGSERAPLHVLHRDKYLVANCTHVVHGDHVRVRQLSHGLRFAQESASTLSTVDYPEGFRSDQLDGNLPVWLRAIPEIDHAHPPAAELGSYHVAAQARATPELRLLLRSCRLGLLEFAGRDELSCQLAGGCREEIARFVIARQQRFDLRPEVWVC